MKKNYIKLIGSIICAFSMFMTVALITLGAQANDKKITYKENVKYEQEDTVPTAPEGYDIADGYLFAGWYMEDGDNKNAAGYSPVEEPVVGQSYVAKYVPSEVLGVKAQVSGQIMDNDTDKITNNKVDNAIRFVTSLDSTEYNHIGFNIKIEGTSYNQDAATTKSVYKTVYGIGADKNNQMTNYYPNTEFHAESVYFKTYTFTTIPASAFDSDITVTPYWITLDGTRVDGSETAVKTVNYGRAWYYVDANGEVTNSAAPVGTYSNPYTTLASAVAVETKLNPRLILKNDITINETVSVARTMAIAGYDTAKTITYENTENNLFTITTAGNLTLDKLALSGGNSAIRNEGGKVAATDVSISGQTYCGVYVDNAGYANLSNLTITSGERGIQLYTGGDVDGNIVKIYSPSKYGVGCDGSTFDITDLTIEDSGNIALNVYAASTGTVNTGAITDPAGHGVNVDAANTTVNLNNVNVNFDTVTSGNIDGIYVNNNAKATLNNVTISDAPRHGISIYNAAEVQEGSSNVTITSPAQNGISCANESSNFNIATLTVNNSGASAVKIFGSGQGTLNGGTITDPTGHGVEAIEGSSSTVKNVDITFDNITSGEYRGVFLKGDSTRLTMDGGSITKAPDQGIKVEAGQIDLTGDITISNSTLDNLYVTGATSKATVAGTVTTNGGRHGVAIYSEADVTNGEQQGTITVNNPNENGVRLYDSGSTLTIGVLNVNNSKAQALEVNASASATIDGGLITVSSSASGDIFAVKAQSNANVTLNNVELKNPINSGLVVWSGSQVTGSNLKVTQAAQKGVWCSDANSLVDINGLTITGCTGDGIRVSQNAQATLKGSVEIASPSWKGIRCEYGTISAADATVTIQSPTEEAVILGTSNAGVSTGAFGNLTITNSSHDGIRLQNNARLTLTGNVLINTPKYMGIRCELGTILATEAVVTVQTPGEYGVRLNGASTGTIGTLNVTGAKAFAAVRAEGTASLTINGGIIKDSQKHGVNALGTATLTMSGVTIQNSGCANDGTAYYDIYKESQATIELTDVTYSSKNYS